MSDDSTGIEIAQALDGVWRPAPSLLAASMAAVRSSPRRSREWPRALFAVAIGVAVVVALLGIRQLAVPPRTQTVPAGLPAPSPVPYSTEPAAQVAWVAESTTQLVGVDPEGRVVGRLNVPAINPYLTFRTPNGDRFVVFSGDHVDLYSALDGAFVVRTARGTSAPVIADAFSPDGRLLAVLTAAGDGGVRINVLDLGIARMLDSAELGGINAGPGWGAGTLAFSGPDTIYALLGWSSHPTLARLTMGPSGLVVTAPATDGRGGHHLPACAAPALVLRALAGGHTLVTFCHQEGAVSFIDTASMNLDKTLYPQQPNPFWQNPVFTPDLHLLYLQYGHSVQVVDLQNRRLLGPGSFGSSERPAGPFSWLGVRDAEAGGVASTMPVSPDGLRFYLAANTGIEAYRVPRLDWVGTLAPGVNVDEVWVSGDGRTLYATVHGGGLVVAPAGGGPVHQLALPAGSYRGFIAAAHG